MCGEPCLAHPAEIGAVDATSHPPPCDHRGRDDNDDDTGKQHMDLGVRRLFSISNQNSAFSNFSVSYQPSSLFRTALSARVCTQRPALESRLPTTEEPLRKA